MNTEEMKLSGSGAWVEWAVLVKLASIAVHAEEFLGPGGHEHDLIALRGLFDDTDVLTLLAYLDEMALIPKRRS